MAMNRHGGVENFAMALVPIPQIKDDEVLGRTYAEYVAAPASDLAHKPTNIPHEQAASATLAALTALQPIQKIGIKKGDRVLDGRRIFTSCGQ